MLSFARGLLKKSKTGNLLINTLQKRVPTYYIQGFAKQQIFQISISKEYATLKKGNIAGVIKVSAYYNERVQLLQGYLSKKPEWFDFPKVITLAHELGHAVNPNNSEQQNINTYENAVRKELGYPLRGSYESVPGSRSYVPAP